MKRFILPLLLAAPLHAQQIDPAMLSDLPPADIVVLGEVHDNPIHHQHQAQAITAIKPAALVFEMLDAEQAGRVTPALRADMAALDKALGWAESGWPDFAIYYPIFAASSAPVYGAAVPRETLRGAMGGDLAALFGAEDSVRFGLDVPLPEAQQQEREAMQMQAHCDALPPEMLPGMVAAQRLRDAELARVALRAWHETGGPVVVVTGNGHARRDWGLPAALAQADPGRRLLSLGQLEAAPEDTPPYDLWLVTAPAEREDPCAAFK